MNPLVSIIIPTFNRVSLIRETLDSLKEQTYINWECIVVDDGSGDNTEEAVLTYVNSDNRFQFIKRPIELPKGGNVCRNLGLNKAKGSYLIFLDSDDILMSFCLENRVKSLQEKLDFLVFPSKSFTITPEDAVFIANVLNKPEDDIVRFLSFDYPWNISSAIIKRSFLLDKKIKWDERLPRHQDLDFYINILSNKPNYIKIDCNPDVAIRGNVEEEGKLSTKKITKNVINGKIQYFDNILKHLSKKDNKKKYSLYLYAFSLRLGKLLVENGYKNKLFSVVVTLLKNRNLFYAICFVPDIIYLKLRTKGELYKKALEYYPFFFKKRFRHFLIKNSTLAKVKLSDYLESKIMNS